MARDAISKSHVGVDDAGGASQRHAPIAVGERAERGSDRIGDGVLVRVADGQRGRAGAGEGAYRGVGVIERGNRLDIVVLTL